MNGRTKTNAKKTVRVNVTKAHIRDGVQSDACNCPIALALKDALFTEYAVVVEDGITVNGKVNFSTDRKDRKFIRDFDSGKPVKPYWFELNQKARR